MLLCISCRYPDKHDCTFDYKNDIEKLTKENPKITSEKINKI